MNRSKFVLFFVLLLVLQSLLFAEGRNVKNTALPASGTRASISVTDLTGSLTPTDLAQALLGGGVTISNIVYTGANLAAGTYSGGTAAGIGIDAGIILSSGSAALATGPNDNDDASTNSGLPGDADLNTLVGTAGTQDACVLEFDFIPETENLQFIFVMGSEEYEEYIDYSDVFAFFLDGVNIALIPGTSTPISIGTINQTINQAYYISNTPIPGTYDIECDGFTVPIAINATVIPGATHHIKLAVADYNDSSYDTWIFLKGGTFASGYNVLVDSEPQGARIFKDGEDTGLITPNTISQATETTSVYYVEMPDYSFLPLTITVPEIMSNQEIFFEGIPDETLPVELSSFTVALNASNQAVLTWVTQTETSVSGFYIYRNTEDDLASAALISNLIPAHNSSQQQVYVYKDEGLNSIGSYQYWLQISDLNGSAVFHGPITLVYEEEDDHYIPIPALTELRSVYPNPFNPNTTLSYGLDEAALVSIKIYNNRGQMVSSIDEGMKDAGSHSLVWKGEDSSGRSLPSGVYYIRMQAGHKSFNKKAVLMK